MDTTYEQDIKKQKETKNITDIELKKKEKVEHYKSILKNAINERYENITEKTRQMEEYKDELEKCKLTAANNIKKIKATSKQIIDREKKLSSDKVSIKNQKRNKIIYKYFFLIYKYFYIFIILSLIKRIGITI